MPLPPPNPSENQPLRFLPRTALGLDVVKHGIVGVFAVDRYWSADRADHWTPGEVLYWQYLPTTAEPAVDKPKVVVTDEMVEAATMKLLGVRCDPAPGVDWHCDRCWKINKVRELMRAALVEALK